MIFFILLFKMLEFEHNFQILSEYIISNIYSDYAVGTVPFYLSNFFNYFLLLLE